MYADIFPGNFIIKERGKERWRGKKERERKKVKIACSLLSKFEFDELLYVIVLCLNSKYLLF